MRSSSARRKDRTSRRGRSRIRAAVRCTTCASRSPTAAISAASTACRRDVFDADYKFLPHAELLTFEEIARIAQLFVARGVAKIRLTGGEPLLRRNIERLVEMLAKTGVADITLTTNGALLAKKAPRAARRRPHARHGQPRFARRRDVSRDERRRLPGRQVLEGIDAAAAAGLAPIKINMVVKRGVNDDAIVPMARHFRGERPHRAVHRVHGRRRDQRLAHGRRRARRGNRARDRRRVSAREARSGTTRARWRSAGATSTAAARSASSPR